MSCSECVQYKTKYQKYKQKCLEAQKIFKYLQCGGRPFGLSSSTADGPYTHTIFNTSRLNLLTEYLRTVETHSCMVLHNSRTIFEYGDIKKPKIVASVRKSILAILYGMYDVDLHKTLEELKIDDVNKLTSMEKKATVENLSTEIIKMLSTKMPDNIQAIGVYIYEGVNKGAHILTNINKK